jgi:hypothetical protein
MEMTRFIYCKRMYIVEGAEEYHRNPQPGSLAQEITGPENKQQKHK